MGLETGTPLCLAVATFKYPYIPSCRLEVVPHYKVDTSIAIHVKKKSRNQAAIYLKLTVGIRLQAHLLSIRGYSLRSSRYSSY